MANIELPKDAEGREIPLNVESLYGANGEAVKPYSFTFRRTDGFCWEMRLVGSPNLVYDPKSFYLNQPDTWEKLEEDMDRCIENSDSCMYFSPGGDCFKCAKPDSETCGCTAAVFNDIKRRIRRLRGEN